jgi:hypothetical protein
VGFFERRPTVAKWILFAVGCAVSLGIAAAALRLGWLRAPWLDALERSYELKASARKEQRILVLGDSFLAAWRTDTHLKKDLETWASERRIGLFNTAKHGSGPAYYYEQIRKVTPEFDPDLVLLFYFVGNDLTDVQYHGMKLDSGGTRPRTRFSIAPRCRIPYPSAPPGGGRFDWDAMVKHGIDPELVARARRIAKVRSSSEGRINPWLLELAMRAPRYLLDNILMDTPCNQMAWRMTAEFLKGIFEIAREAGADLHLIAVPATVQIDRSHFDFYRRASLQVDDRLLVSTRPQQLLAALCARQGVPMLDLLPHFERHSDPASLYWPTDSHFSEAGHRLAFQIVREEILDPWLAGRRLAVADR